MQAANAVAAKFNAPLPFNKDTFDDLIYKYGIHHNSVLEALR